MRVTVIGDVMVDVIARVDGPIVPAGDTPAAINIRPGGSAANVAAWLASLGVSTTFIGCVGDDTFGREARIALEAHGVVAHLAVAPTLSTGTCVVVVGADGERTMLPDHGANAVLAVTDLPESAFPNGGHLHLTGYSFFSPAVRPVALAALERARTQGMTISVDASSAAPLAQLGVANFLASIGTIETLFVTVDEAEVLSGRRVPAEVASRLCSFAGCVVLKLGGEGAVQLCEGAVVPRVAKAERRVPVRDTTGAGDAFAAGWIAAQQSGATGGESLDRACRAGAVAVTLTGARPSPTPPAAR